MADISNVITVQISQGGRLAARDNLNVVSIMTSETGVLTSANRYAIYKGIAAVALDWGTASPVYEYAASFFATSPNPVSANGYLVVGFWRASDESVAATAATIKGSELVEATVVGNIRSVSDGSFTIVVDGVSQDVTGLDFRTVTSLQDIADILDLSITNADVTLDQLGLVITSKTTGATSTLTLPVAFTSGTFVGVTLGISANTGAVLTNGSAATVLTAETKVDAITALKAEVNVYGAMFIDSNTSAEVAALATYAQAAEMLIYDVFSDPTNLVIDPTNPVWSVVLSSQTNYRMLYSKAGNRKMAASYMARAHVVNFNGENTALTMHLKELSVPAEDYTETEIANAKAVGLDIYTTIKNVPCILTSGANDFMDNRYNLIGFKDALETDMFNLYKGTATKIPQTQRGVNAQLDQLDKTTRNFVRCGVFGAGTWSSPDFFGNIDTFNRAIEQNGFYWMAGSLADQDQASRELRESVVFQGACKMAGATHHGNVIVNINK